MIERGERMTGFPLRATSAVGCGTRATLASATAAVKRNTSEARERRSKLADPTPAVRAAPELRRRRVRGHLARRRAPRGHVVSPGLQIGGRLQLSEVGYARRHARARGAHVDGGLSPHRWCRRMQTVCVRWVVPER